MIFHTLAHSINPVEFFPGMGCARYEEENRSYIGFGD